MVNPIGHWLQVPFCTRSRIPLRGLFGFRVPPGLVVPAQPLLVPVRQSFEFYIYFCCCFDISGSHFSMVPYRVVICDIVCQVFLSLFPEYVEMVFPDSVSDLIKSHVYYLIYFLLCLSVDYAVCRCIFRSHRCGWLVVAHLC